MQANRGAALLAAVALVATGVPVHAQDAPAEPIAPVAAPAQAVAVAYVDDGLPFGAAVATREEIAAVKMPELAFTPDATDPANYDKYYYFQRPDTDFAAAYADVRECDGYARGLQSGISYMEAPYPYAGTMAGAIGGAIGSAMAMAIFGSAEKRRLRRVNMRTCMHFKGYSRYGLSKTLWEKFNFEEGLSGVSEADRTRYLMQQALVASSAKPEAKELGL